MGTSKRLGRATGGMRAVRRYSLCRCFWSCMFDTRTSRCLVPLAFDVFFSLPPPLLQVMSQEKPAGEALSRPFEAAYTRCLLFAPLHGIHRLAHANNPIPTHANHAWVRTTSFLSQSAKTGEAPPHAVGGAVQRLTTTGSGRRSGRWQQAWLVGWDYNERLCRLSLYDRGPQ